MKRVLVVLAVMMVVTVAVVLSKGTVVIESECSEQEALSLAKDVSENFNSGNVLIRGEHSYYVGKIGIVEIVGKPTILNARLQYFSATILRKAVYCMIAVAVIAEFALFVMAGMNTILRRVKTH